MFACVSNGVILFKCYLVSFYRQGIGLCLPLMAPQGRFLFICAEVSTYRKEKKVRNNGTERGYAERRDELSVFVQFLVIDSSHWYDTMIDRPSTSPISLLTLIHPVPFHILLRFVFWYFLVMSQPLCFFLSTKTLSLYHIPLTIITFLYFSISYYSYYLYTVFTTLVFLISISCVLLGLSFVEGTSLLIATDEILKSSQDFSKVAKSHHSLSLFLCHKMTGMHWERISCR